MARFFQLIFGVFSRGFWFGSLKLYVDSLPFSIWSCCIYFAELVELVFCFYVAHSNIFLVQLGQFKSHSNICLYMAHSNISEWSKMIKIANCLPDSIDLLLSYVIIVFEYAIWEPRRVQLLILILLKTWPIIRCLSRLDWSLHKNNCYWLSNHLWFIACFQARIWL